MLSWSRASNNKVFEGRWTWYASWFDTILLIIVAVVISSGLSRTLKIPTLIGIAYGLPSSYITKIICQRKGVSWHHNNQWSTLCNHMQLETSTKFTFWKSSFSATVPRTTNDMLNVVICSPKKIKKKKNSSYIINKDPCHDFDQASLNQRRREILRHNLIRKMS